MEKKEWKRPELIVLMRSKPEESVLTGCKVTGGAGSHGANNACLWEALCQSVCSQVDVS